MNNTVLTSQLADDGGTWIDTTINDTWGWNGKNVFIEYSQWWTSLSPSLAGGLIPISGMKISQLMSMVLFLLQQIVKVTFLPLAGTGASIMIERNWTLWFHHSLLTSYGANETNPVTIRPVFQ